MRKISLLALVCLFSIISFAQGKHDIKFTIHGLDPNTDTSALLLKYYGKTHAIMDSLDITLSPAQEVNGKIISTGTIKVSGDTLLDGGQYTMYLNPEEHFDFMVTEQEFELETVKDDFYGKMKVKNSPENEAYYKHLDLNVSMSEKVVFYQDIRKSIPLEEKRPAYFMTFSGDTIFYDKISKETDKAFKYTSFTGSKENLNKDVIKYYTNDNNKFILADFEEGSEGPFNFVLATDEYCTEKVNNIHEFMMNYMENVKIEHKDKLFIKAMLAAMDPELPKDLKDEERFPYYKAHFFDNLDWNDGRLVNTTIYQKRLETYFERCVYQVSDSIIMDCDYVLEKASANPDLFRFTLAHLLNKYVNSQIMCMDKVYVHLVDNYYAKGRAFWATDYVLEKFKVEANMRRWSLCGNKAANITLHDPTGKPTPLYSLNGDYTWIIFWTPDCGHCKKAMPKFVKYYNELKEDPNVKEKINVYTVCTEEVMDKWKKFIKEKGIEDWTNVADSTGENHNFRGYYNINSTPKLYVLDKDKKIIAKGIGAEQLPDFFNRVLGREATKKEEVK